MRRANSSCCFLAQLSPFRRSPVTSCTAPASTMAFPRVRIAVVGDVHDQWDAVQDRRALEELKPDLVLFTGDFGDENVELVHSVSQLDFVKAVILGNHDCWNTADLIAREGDGCCPLSPKREYNAVELQLQSLGDCHVGYKRIDFSELKLSVIGGRPFSSGGKTFGPAYGIVSQRDTTPWRPSNDQKTYNEYLKVARIPNHGDEIPNHTRLIGKESSHVDECIVPLKLIRFGIKGMNQSAGKISSLALKAPTDHALVFLGHNGPTGLGSKPADICGKDWSLKSSADHGDPDLQAALKKVKERGLHNVQLVIFGHMHKELAYNRGDRTMLVRGQDDIIYVNAAIVPRVIDVNSCESSTNNGGLETVQNFNACESSTYNGGLETMRNFTVIDLDHGRVEKVAETWVRVGERVSVEQEAILYSSDSQQNE